MQSHQDLTLTTNLIIYHLEHSTLSNFDMLIILHKTMIYFFICTTKIYCFLSENELLKLEAHTCSYYL